MCGISGFNFKDENLIKQMVRVLGHRGPDDSGIFLDEAVSLGHDRLSILDLSPLGAQPMKSHDGRLTIVFNGEIYNFRELREELAVYYPFKSQSDTEVILAAYSRWGRECVKKFNGIFALAIWDARERELFLARDQAGVKPLYYFFDGRRFIFASEIKALLVHDLPRQVDREAFNFYFHLYYVPEPLTMFAGVKKLPAASWAIWCDGQLKIEKYWAVTDFSDLVSPSEARVKILDIFQDSVRRQLISDRPVGVFLSGGIDSTAVLGAVAEAASPRPRTFSVGFDVPEQSEKFNADFNLARETARHYGADHNELLISGRDILDNLEKIVWHLDEPNFNPTAAAMFLLSQMAKKKVAVVLGGDGGDELFGGYPRYYASRLIGIFQRWPRAAQEAICGGLSLFGRRNLADKLKLPSTAARILVFLSEKQSLLEEVLPSELIYSSLVECHFAEKYFGQFDGSTELAAGKLRVDDFLAGEGDFEKLFMNIDRQSWLVDESLARTDKMTMAWGLEARVPILDRHLVELAAKIPTAWKFGVLDGPLASFQGKKIWREAIGRYVPSSVASQKKRGWFTPMAKWLRTDLRDFVATVLSPENLNADYFNVAAMQKIWQDHLSGRRYNLNLIWATVMWQLWHDRFIKS